VSETIKTVPFFVLLFVSLFVLLLLLGGCEQSSGRPAIDDLERNKSQIVRIGFGSCADDDEPTHKVWDALLATDPDVLLMVGDNVYADSDEFKSQPSVAVMQSEYAKLAASPGFAQLRATRPVFATWDDHDFGENDGGAAFAFKTESAQIFEDFWDYPADDPARGRPGIYTERRIDRNGIDIQVLLLDTRTFRGPLEDAPRSLACPLKNYVPNTTGTFLGEDQWIWLAERLATPADLRLLVSGQQVIADEHCFEKWGNFPHERLRLFETLRASGAANVVLISGDRHLGEISKLEASAENGTGFDLFEVTSSPLSARSGFGWGETNSYRVSDDNLRESQFGLLDVSRLAGTIRVQMELRDAQGAQRFVQLAEFVSSASPAVDSNRSEAQASE